VSKLIFFQAFLDIFKIFSRNGLKLAEERCFFTIGDLFELKEIELIRLGVKINIFPSISRYFQVIFKKWLKIGRGKVFFHDR